MIQRKQSLWLFIAALLNSGVLFFDIYHTGNTQTMANGAAVVNKTEQLRVGNNFPLLIIALVMILIPLITIFMFRNRKRQIRLSAVSIVATLSFLGMALALANKVASASPGGSYWLGAILPVISLVFLIMAMAGIRRDEKLVKSVDRLR